MIDDAADRASQLTANLLAFARKQPLRPLETDVNALVEEVVQLLSPTLGRQIEIETALSDQAWPALIDRGQLSSALVNLAINARDAMPEGGKVTIETANCYLDESYVSAIPEPVDVGQYVMIAVADTGTGMDPLTVERAFEPFFTTKEVGRGTGLGLSQVYGFVRQSAGHVRVYSELDEGTTVKIYLPCYVGADEHVEAAEPTRAANGAIGTETILVVEDDEALRSYTVETLAELGYRVLSATNGAAAIDILDSGADIDLLFTDVVMPGGLNGRQLANEAVRRRPGLKVLFTTGYTRNAIVHHGRLDPGLEMIGKPFSSDELTRKVRAILDGSA
jgi:CheY-like chemotaxis protein